MRRLLLFLTLLLTVGMACRKVSEPDNAGLGVQLAATPRPLPGLGVTLAGPSPNPENLLTQDICTVDAAPGDSGALNLRKGPGTDTEVIKVLTDGQRLRVVRRAGDWLQVYAGSELGYVAIEFVRCYE